MATRRLTINTPRLKQIITRYHFLMGIGIVALLIAGEILFLYKYFYKPLTATRLIGSFREQAAVERVEIERFQKIEKFHEAKRKLPEIPWSKIHDPFIKPAVTALPTQSAPSP